MGDSVLKTIEHILNQKKNVSPFRRNQTALKTFSQRATRAGLGHLIMSCLVVIVAIISIFCVAMSLQQSLFSVEPVLLPQNNVRDHSQDYFNQEPNLAVLHPL